MAIFNTGDLHFGHNAILKYRKGFKDLEEHDNVLLDQFASLHKNDIVIVHGDFLFDSIKYDWYIEQLSKMSCRIKLILGNHDSLKLYKESRLPRLELQLPLYTYKGFWLSHCPIHPDEMRKRDGNIHGHTHNHCVDSDDYYNVSLDVHDYKFVNFEKIKEDFKKRGSKYGTI